MAVYLLDTSTISYLMDDPVRAQVLSVRVAPGDRVVTCSIVRGEVYFGLALLAAGRRRRNLEAAAATLFAGIACEPVPEAAGDHSARLKHQARRAGTSVDGNDLWIAATALAIGAVLVTTDRDFSRLPALVIEDWTT